MRLKLSALFLSTALATGLVAGTMLALTPAAPIAMAQVPSEVDVDALLKLLPSTEVTATYDSKSYDAMTGITTVKGLKLADPKNPTANYAAVEELGLRGVDVDAFGYVFDFSKYTSTRDETFKQLFGDVSIKNASVVVEGKTVAACESFTFGGVQMKQLQNVQPGFAAGSEPAVEQNDDNDLKFAGALLDSIIAGKLEIANFTAEKDGQKTSIKSLSLDGFNRGQLGAIALDTFESDMANMTGPDGQASYTKIASAKNEGIDISKLLPWMMKAQMPPVTAEPLLYFGAAEATGLDYNIMGTKLTLASESIDAINFYWLVPSSLKFKIDDMVVTLPQGGAAGAPGDELKELGIDHLDLDMGLDWSFDGAGKTAKLTELRIEESQLFNTTLALDLQGIDLARLVDSATSTAAASEIGLSFAQLFVKNNGGFEKLLTMAAKEQNTTPDALKQQGIAQITAMEGGMPGPDGQVKPPSDRVKSILEAIKAFLQSPGTITVKVQPATPVTIATGMGAMFDPMSAADALGITVESTPQ